MKTIILGAAGLLLSSTALAAVLDKKADPAATPAAVQDSKAMGLAASAPLQAKDAESLDGSMIGNAMLIDWPEKSVGAEPASDAKSFDVGTKQLPEPAAAEAPSTAALSDKTAAAEQGMGGPDEPEAMTTAAVAPATSYRPCSPGPGDDNCIQLYEPGDAEAYAAWQGARGVPGTEQTAMGGPEEPVEGAAAIPAAATSYPPCRSRADDRCIQPGENETLASAEGMGGPEELAAYEPLPEDAVMPASADPVYKDGSENTQAI